MILTMGDYSGSTAFSILKQDSISLSKSVVQTLIRKRIIVIAIGLPFIEEAAILIFALVIYFLERD